MTADTITLTKVSAAHPVLAAHAHAIHHLAESETESLAEYILEVGRHLHEARWRAEHKVWVVWIADEFGWNPATALKFIRTYLAALETPIYAHNSRGERSVATKA